MNKEIYYWRLWK